MVFAVSGEGGVGKSTLLSQFAAIAGGSEVGGLVLTCDERHTTPLRAMAQIAADLAAQGLRHAPFALLRAAIDLDPIARLYALQDDLLAPLRERPDVQALLAAPPGPSVQPAA